MAARQFAVPLPPRMRRLPVDSRGFPVPWFVAWHGADGQEVAAGQGTPDFRIVARDKRPAAVRHRRCWVCGEPLGANLSFVIGPMCAINRTISEPPSHYTCGEFSARCCPFLANPRMRRNEKGMADKFAAGDIVEAAGMGLARNPGVACLWTCRGYKTFRPQGGAPGILFSLGEPLRVDWFAQGRAATRAEVQASIDSGLPALKEVAAAEGPAALAALDQYVARALPLLPSEAA